MLGLRSEERSVECSGESGKEKLRMNRCVRCGFPDTRPGMIFEKGTCQACLNFEKRRSVDWTERGEYLGKVCEDARGKGIGYDVLIPVSGGKDSHTLVHEMEERGMRILLFNVADWFTTTRAGAFNLANLARRHNLITMKMSRELFVKATRHAFERTGEALKYIEYLIYLWPIRYAQKMGIPLVLFGEDSAYQYGTSKVESTSANDQVSRMADSFRAETKFWTEAGIEGEDIERGCFGLTTPFGYPMVLWASYFWPWDSQANLRVAKAMGFRTLSDTGEWDRKGVFSDDDFEQMDSVAYLVHLWLKYPKFGFQRAMDTATRRWRLGAISAEERDRAIVELDPVLDPWARHDFCMTLGYAESEFWEVVGRICAKDASGNPLYWKGR